MWGASNPLRETASTEVNTYMAGEDSYIFSRLKSLTCFSRRWLQSMKINTLLERGTLSGIANDVTGK